MKNREDNLIPCKPGERPPGAGRPKGTRNRSTIAKQILQARANAPKEIRTSLEKYFGELPKKITIEELMAYAQMVEAIAKRSTSAYRELMDSAYGKAKEALDVTSGGEPITKVEVVIHERKPSESVGDAKDTGD